MVTNIPSTLWEADALYERLYCGRGNMENRIKEQQLYLFADRTSTGWMSSNQLRLVVFLFRLPVLCAPTRGRLERNGMGEMASLLPALETSESGSDREGDGTTNLGETTRSLSVLEHLELRRRKTLLSLSGFPSPLSSRGAQSAHLASSPSMKP